MPTFRWSNKSLYWRNLCSNTLAAETSVPNVEGSCEICIDPIEVPPVDPGTGTVTGTGTTPEPGTGGGIEEGGP